MARALQRTLQTFAKPWRRRRSMNVFRDETDLSVNPDLWHSITASLSKTDWLILIASPESAASKWVTREIRDASLDYKVISGAYKWRRKRTGDRRHLATARPYGIGQDIVGGDPAEKTDPNDKDDDADKNHAAKDGKQANEQRARLRHETSLLRPAPSGR